MNLIFWGGPDSRESKLIWRGGGGLYGLNPGKGTGQRKLKETDMNGQEKEVW